MRRPDPELVAFYDRYAHVILRRSRALLDDPEVAATAVLSTFEEAVAAWDRVENTVSPLIWLYRESTGQARRLGGDQVKYWSEAGGDELTWRCLVHAREDRMGPREAAELVAIAWDDAVLRAPELATNGSFSRLQLERFATGELVGEARGEAQRALAGDPAAMGHLDALKKLRKEVPKFDVEAASLRRPMAAVSDGAEPAERKITETQDDRPASNPDSATAQPAAPRGQAPAELEATPGAPIAVVRPAVRIESARKAPLQVPAAPSSRLALWAVPAVVVALFLLIVASQYLRHPGHHLDVYVGGVPYRNEVLEPGMKVRFAADSPTVLVAVEPDGTVTVRHPTLTRHPVSLGDDATFSLGEVSGPEMFVAVFGRDVDEAKAAVAAAYASGQSAGVLRWADTDGQAIAVVLQRK